MEYWEFKSIWPRARYIGHRGQTSQIFAGLEPFSGLTVVATVGQASAHGGTVNQTAGGSTTVIAVAGRASARGYLAIVTITIPSEPTVTATNETVLGDIYLGNFYLGRIVTQAMAQGGRVVLVASEIPVSVSAVSGGRAVAIGGDSTLFWYTEAFDAADGKAFADGGDVVLSVRAITVTSINGSARAKGGTASLSHTVMIIGGNARATGGVVNLSVTGGGITVSAAAGFATGKGGTVTLALLSITLYATGGKATAFGRVTAAYIGSVLDTHPPLGGLYDDGTCAGVINDGPTGGRVTSIKRSGRVLIPVVSGRLD